MSAGCESCGSGTSTCGCCMGLQARTPAEVVNRPGLSAVAYRVGTYAQFRQSLLASLSDSNRLPLAALATREEDDFTIALLEAWAMVADVLTFYQERIANESYLRTATEPFSVVELVRALGYELAPGVAASTYLAFTLEDGPGAPGYATIDAGTKVQSVPGPGETPQTFETIEKTEAKAAWNTLKPKQKGEQSLSVDMSTLKLVGLDLNLRPGDSLLLSASGAQALERIETVEVDRTAGETTVTLGLVGAVSGESVPAGVWALRVAAAPFGYNAPRQVTVSNAAVSYGEWSLDTADTDPTQLHLSARYDRIARGEWAVVARSTRLGGGYAVARVSSAQPTFRSSYGIAGEVTLLTLSSKWIEQLDGKDLSALRGVVAYAQSDPLTPAEVPLTEAIADREIPLDGDYGDLEKGRTIFIAGKDASGAEIGEAALLAKVEGNPTVLTLVDKLQFAYDRARVTIYGNVAAATHGETRREVLGSGDASQPFQRFGLHQSPLTYVSADVPSGGVSTLQVRVNDVLWQEVPALFQRGPRDRVYSTRRDSEGKTTIQFGDGKAGARPATGQENISAVYRQGLGQAGMLKAEQLSLLLTRPLGVKAVTNPRPPTGAKDPEDMARARSRAPRTVLTMDRIVSREDYADFACGFAGIAKALATWVWWGDKRGVLVTVAAEEGDHLVPESSTLYQNLLSAMQKASDPLVPIRLKSYRSVPFTIDARVQVDSPTYLADKVLADVRAALTDRFSCEARDFGQGVARSEVIAVIQGISGVVMVDVNQLSRPNEASAAFLPANTPAPGAHVETVQAAELLTLDPASLEKVQALP